MSQIDWILEHYPETRGMTLGQGAAYLMQKGVVPPKSYAPPQEIRVETATLMVERCARCEQDHEVEFFKFAGNPVFLVEKSFTHWGLCPNTDEPILMYVEQKREDTMYNPKNSLTQEHIDSIVANSQIEVVDMGKKTTVVTLTMPNGFEITESAACVDPANYDQRMGTQVALDRIKSILWRVEGYRLHHALMGDEDSLDGPTLDFAANWVEQHVTGPDSDDDGLDVNELLEAIAESLRAAKVKGGE